MNPRHGLHHCNKRIPRESITSSLLLRFIWIPFRYPYALLRPSALHSPITQPAWIFFLSRYPDQSRSSACFSSTQLTGIVRCHSTLLLNVRRRLNVSTPRSSTPRSTSPPGCRQSPGNAPAHDTTVAVAQQTIWSKIDMRTLLGFDTSFLCCILAMVRITGRLSKYFISKSGHISPF